MKTVTLPNGKVAHFPDTIHPDKMQAAIDRHGKEKPAIMVMHDHENTDDRNAREARQEDSHNKRHKAMMEAMSSHNQKTNAAVTEHAKATTSVAQGVNQGLDAVVKTMKANAQAVALLGQRIDALSRGAGEIKELAKCVDGLQEQIKQSTELLIKVMKSPRKIVHSPKGRPLGMQIED